MKQGDKQIKEADQVINTICDGFEQARLGRTSIRTELEDISNQQQLVAKQRVAEPPVKRRRSSIGSMTANNQALAAWYSETTSTLSRLAGVTINGVYDTNNGGVDIHIGFVAVQGLTLVASYDADLREIGNLKVEPRTATMFEELIGVALQEKWPLCDIVRHFVASINHRISQSK